MSSHDKDCEDAGCITRRESLASIATAAMTLITLFMAVQFQAVVSACISISGMICLLWIHNVIKSAHFSDMNVK